MSAVITLLISVAGLAGRPVSAEPCPLSLPTSSVQVRGPQGWTGYTPGPLHLFGFGMMDGPPETLTYLVPKESRSKLGGGFMTWEVSGTEIWMYCTYGGADSIQISRVIASNVEQCSVSYTESRKGGKITSMTVKCLHK